MGEKLPLPGSEQLRSVETSAEHQHKLEKTIESGKHEKHHAQESLEQIQRTIEEEAVSGKEIAPRIGESGTQGDLPFIDESSKKVKFQQSLGRIQKRLSRPDRILSKVIHQPIVNAVSEISAKTVARPSGILGGGFFALLGSSILVYASRHYGFRYNYLLFFILFFGGFLVGMALEISFFAARHSKKRHR